MGFKVFQQATLPSRQLGGHTSLNEGELADGHPSGDWLMLCLIYFFIKAVSAPVVTITSRGGGGVSLPVSSSSGGRLFKLILEEQQSALTSNSSFGELNSQIHFTSCSLTFYIKAKQKQKLLPNVQKRHLLIGRVIRKQ